MTSIELPTLLETATQAANAAEAVLLERHPARVSGKGERDVVSDLDFEIERLLRAALTRATPQYGFLGEEEGESGPDGPTRWVVDPIDGTVNYVHGLPLCGIAIALVHHGDPLLGVIHLPYLGRRYRAASGFGAWRDGQPIHATPAGQLAHVMIAIGDYGTGPDAPERNQVALALHAALAPTAQRVRMLGSAAVDLALVADGTLGASLTLGNRPWDMAAGVAIAREAGALLTDTDGTPYTSASRTTIAIAPGLTAPVHALLRAATAGTSYSTVRENTAC